MIVIPMLGKSSRFFSVGYTLPKYQLPLGNETVFAKCIRSFECQFSTEPFLFLVRKDHFALRFVSEEISKLGIKDFRIIEVDHETKGQADSVALGIKDYCDDTSLLIFNIDTIRHNFDFPSPEKSGDGFLEVFRSEGSNWSFVEAGQGTRVIRTTEKDRISDLCCNGIYSFSKVSDFNEAFHAYNSAGYNVQGELYIAPLYNYLIENNRNIHYRLIDIKNIDHCGIPEDYEKLKAQYKI